MNGKAMLVILIYLAVCVTVILGYTVGEILHWWGG